MAIHDLVHLGQSGSHIFLAAKSLGVLVLKEVDLLLHDSVLLAELLLLRGQFLVLVDSCLRHLFGSSHLLVGEVELLLRVVEPRGQVGAGIGELLFESPNLTDLFIDDSMELSLLLERVFLLVMDEPFVVFFHRASLRFESIIGLN